MVKTKDNMENNSMQNIERYLITTPDERAWKFDRPVVFIGEWCRLYERRHIWQDLDAVVVPPYGIDSSVRVAAYEEARVLDKKLFPILCDLLNGHHSTRHGSRFWKIVCGYWFKSYINIVTNRFKTLQQCLESYSLSGVTLLSGSDRSFVPNDSHEAILNAGRSGWDHEMFIRILKKLRVHNCPIEIMPVDHFYQEEFVKKVSFRKDLLWAIRLAFNLVKLLSRECDAFIVNTYLPIEEEIKLQLAIGQIPQLWSSPKINFRSPDHELRQRLASRISQENNDDNLEGIVRSMLFECIPVCYLEAFGDVMTSVQKTSWPKSPKFIFTSNNFAHDEVFKLWAAQKTELGCKYFVGQHGNGYGTNRFFQPIIEEITADKFFTWGWTDGLPQHTPAFIFKTVGKKPCQYNCNGGLLLIEISAPLRRAVFDEYYDFCKYFEGQKEFIKKLCPGPKNKLTVRPYSMLSTKWGDHARWNDFDNTLKFDSGITPIRKLISNSRLIVHSYDSTGILETLSQNIPTLAFWVNGLDYLTETSRPYYQILVDAGILHLSPESTAAKVNEIWDDVDGWWGRTEVQEARAKFCKQYANICDNPIKTLSKLLIES